MVRGRGRGGRVRGDRERVCVCVVNKQDETEKGSLMRDEYLFRCLAA